MGACNAANYISNQPERNRIVNIRFVNDRRYLSYARLLRTGELFGMGFIFDTIPNRLVAFDYDTFHGSPQRCVVAVTDCITGEAVYYDKGELGDDYLRVLQASCSLPFISRPVRYHGRTFMDGGLADSIPLARSIQDGYRRHVLVLTQPRGYRKQPSRLTSLLVRLRYPRFKGLQRKLDGRAEAYNQTLEWIENLEDEGRIFVVRPRAALMVGRVERNQEKLYATYDQGVADARECHDALYDYLAQKLPA
jgi:predicted patatin/cPLA2 family phospholipase